MPYISLNDDVLGSYHCNGFCIIIGEDAQIFERYEKKAEIKSIDDFAVFIHEYWHYIENISTINGIVNFSLWQQLMILFSKTVQTNGIVNAECLCDKERELLNSIINLIQVSQGSSYPNNLHNSVFVVDFSVSNYEVSEISLEIEGQKLSCHSVKLNLLIDVGTTSIEKDCLFGDLCISEGLAHEISMIIYGKETPEHQTPLFPYLVLRKVAKYILGESIESKMICSIATLSLLTTEPSKTFIELLELYKETRKEQDDEQSITILWEKIKEEYYFHLKIMIKELDNLVEIHNNRGLVSIAMDYLSEQYTELLNKRLQDPLFDLKPFMDNKLNVSELLKLQNTLIPCDTIQEEIGEDDKLCKDHMVSFGVQKEWKETGFRPTDFLRVLQCQLSYLNSHLKTYGFLSSKDIKSNRVSCPFYNVCNLETRRTNSLTCKNKPWEVVELQGRDKCWYGSAVLSIIGICDVYGKKCKDEI